MTRVRQGCSPTRPTSSSSSGTGSTPPARGSTRAGPCVGPDSATQPATVRDGAFDDLRQMRAAGWLPHVERTAAVASGDVPLTPTEARISDLVAGGRRNREIAGELAISVGTVEAHLTRIYRKLHVRSRTELARVVRSG